MDIFNNFKSKLVFHYFHEISKIPRESSNEKAISDYLVSFAKSKKLEVIQDESLNVIIKKPGTPGYENVPTVIIQGHMDMVCEKNKDTEHDFKKDPIKLRIIGDMLYATNTTLGADNGTAIAYGLALIDSNEISHPPLELLFTTEEETTFLGAMNLDHRHLNGKILLNLDSGEEGVLLVSSAGGAATTQTLPIVWADANKDLVGFKVSIGGLIGGHSGEDIHRGRGNSNKLLGRILNDLSKEFEYFIRAINGGIKANAIPREAEAVVLIRSDSVEILQSKVNDWNAILRNEFRTSDPKIYIKLEKVQCAADKVFSEETKDKAIAALILIPSGIQSMSMDIEGLVESSTNLGVIKTLEDKIVFENETRSSIESLRQHILDRLKVVGDVLSCEMICHLSYPEWPYSPHSKIRKLFESVYKNKYGVEPKVTALHAGLECGILLEKMPYLDAISYGPNMYELHTPEEHLSISSVENTWEYLLDVLKEINSTY